MTTGPWAARFRVAITVKGKQGLIVLDQIRTLDRVRTPTCYASPCELTV
jgi:mRNA-degrading endonuclease toxin of MazEF toxin-antitoxin module